MPQGTHTGDSLTDEQLDTAARLYFCEDWSWSVIAKDFLKCSFHTLLAARESDRWPPIRARYQVKLEDLRTLAYEKLAMNVKRGDTVAIKEALARTEGLVTQPLDVTLREGDPLELLRSRLAPPEADPGEGSDPGGTET